MPQHFSNDWFKADVISNFELVKANLPVGAKILEIGCYEGQATTWMIQNMEPAVVHVIDTFEGSIEHSESQKTNLRDRFTRNMSEFSDVIEVHMGFSHVEMCKLVPEFEEYFDFIYVDASHTSWDVLADAVIAFNLLLKQRGIMVFDDYEWKFGGDPDPLFSPAKGIDSFLSIYRHFYELLFSNYQIGILKKDRN